jgi:hypothetical protein
MVLREHNYVFEPTGADSPSQNGGVETYNDKLAVRTRTLLYGANLPARYWSAALLHAVYLNNRLVHTVTKKTPFEGFYGHKPDIEYLKMFGSRVCVKQSGDRRSKLDRHDFTGIFLGYTASDQNIRYLDLDSGVVKSSHHAVFDEAWYMQPHRPPAAQLLFDLGLEPEERMITETGPENRFNDAVYPPYVPLMVAKQQWAVPPRSLQLPLPLRCTALPNCVAAAAARTFLPPLDAERNEESLPLRCRGAQLHVSALAAEYNVDSSCMDMIYMSPSPYHDAFDEILDIRKCDLSKHPTAGMSLLQQNGRLILAHMAPGTPAARFPDGVLGYVGLG